MLKTLGRLVLASTCVMSATLPAHAHFQLAYTPEVNVSRAGDQPVKLIFWHPFENGHVMDMAEPLDFYAVNRGKKIDLKSTLSPITFTGSANSAAAFDGVLTLRRSGDYVMVVVPAPYYEESEDIFIQQLTKSYVSRNEIPTDWMEPQGLKTEILPLNRPTNIIAGSTFTGRVLSDGKPLAGVEVEVEYMAAEPDMASNTPQEPTASPMPGVPWSHFPMKTGISHSAFQKRAFGGSQHLAAALTKNFRVKSFHRMQSCGFAPMM